MSDDGRERLRERIQSVLEAADDYASMVEATRSQLLPPRFKTLAPYREKFERAAMLAVARAQRDTLKALMCHYQIKGCVEGEYTRRHSFWCDRCLALAAAEALCAELEAE